MQSAAVGEKETTTTPAEMCEIPIETDDKAFVPLATMDDKAVTPPSSAPSATILPDDTVITNKCVSKDDGKVCEDFDKTQFAINSINEICVPPGLETPPSLAMPEQQPPSLLSSCEVSPLLSLHVGDDDVEQEEDGDVPLGEPSAKKRKQKSVTKG